MGAVALLAVKSDTILRQWFKKTTYKRSFPYIKAGLRIGGLLLTAWGLLGPYWVSKEEKLNVLGKEIFFLLDVSASMNAEDIKPTRIAYAKEAIEYLIKDLKGDRVGLIVYANNPYVQCPLTTDFQAFSLYLEVASTEEFHATGTNLRPALFSALERMLSKDKQVRNYSQAIVLLTDGENFGESYLSVLERLNDAGIQVFVAGIGSKEGAPIPDIEKGRKRGYKRKENGEMILSVIAEEELRKIATYFGTEYVNLSENNKALQSLKEQIRYMRATPMAVRKQKMENNRFQSLLFLGFILISTSLFLIPVKEESAVDG